MLENLEKIKKETVDSYCFLTMKNLMFNKLLYHNRKLCCEGDFSEYEVESPEYDTEKDKKQEELLKSIEDKNIDVLGIDWRMSLPTALKELGGEYMIQGNFDPSYLHYDWDICQKKLDQFWAPLKNSSLPLDKWICGLGHGVLQETPESNVRKTVEYIHENFLY
jgi:hypothetical protein